MVFVEFKWNLKSKCVNETFSTTNCLCLLWIASDFESTFQKLSKPTTFDWKVVCQKSVNLYTTCSWTGSTVVNSLVGVDLTSPREVNVSRLKVVEVTAGLSSACDFTCCPRSSRLGSEKSHCRGRQRHWSLACRCPSRFVDFQCRLSGASCLWQYPIGPAMVWPIKGTHDFASVRHWLSPFSCLCHQRERTYFVSLFFLGF